MTSEDTYGSWFDRIADAGTAYLKTRNAPARPAASAAPAQPAWLKPVLLGGGALAVVLVIVLALKRK